jgi:hypothetical protein
VSGITVLLYTQGLNSQTLLFGYFQYFSILFMFLSDFALSADYFLIFSPLLVFRVVLIGQPIMIVMLYLQCTLLVDLREGLRREGDGWAPLGNGYCNPVLLYFIMYCMYVLISADS